MQLRGEKVPFKKLNSSCAPVSQNKDLWKHQQYSWEGRKKALELGQHVTDGNFEQYKFSNLTEAAVPCGLIARSVFNDTFKLMKVTEKDGNKVYTEVKMNQKNIAWKSDIAYRYKNFGDRPASKDGKTPLKTW